MQATEEVVMRSSREHAVVIGASVAGLLAARALSEFYEQVTVVERDELPAFGEGRRSIPQGRHVHALLPSGQRCMEELLPGIERELLAAGAEAMQPLEEMRFSIQGHLLTRGHVGVGSLVASRPLIEGCLRRRVAALANVRLRDRCDAVGLLADGERVCGVRVLPRAQGSAEEELRADLVVAAGGRAGRLPAWLDALGYARPQEDELPIDVRYVSRRLRIVPGAVGPDKLVLIGARPGRARGMALELQEHGEWLLTVSGYGRENHPPTDVDGMLRFAATVAPPDVLAAIRNAEPLGEIATHAFPANRRRRYERLDRFPAGLLPIGDAIASFNPLHGQGMSVAALEAVALRRCLAAGDEALGRRFFSEAARIVDHAWEMAVGGDLALPEVAGTRPLRLRISNAYFERALRAAEHDLVVATAIMRIGALLDRPPQLLRPAIAWRVLARRILARRRPAVAREVLRSDAARLGVAGRAR